MDSINKLVNVLANNLELSQALIVKIKEFCKNILFKILSEISYLFYFAAKYFPLVHELNLFHRKLVPGVFKPEGKCK